MQFTISRAAAVTVATQLLKTCNGKNEKSKLDGYFYFEVVKQADGALVLQAVTTNGLADQTAIVPTNTLQATEGDGFFADAGIFTEFMKTFSHDDITCKLVIRKGVTDGELVVGSQSKNTYITIPTVNKNNYAPLHFLSNAPEFNVEGKILSKALRQTAFSASSDGKLPAISAVKLNINKNKLTAVSCDNSRISRSVFDIEDVGAVAEFLVPKTSAEILGSLLAIIDTVKVSPGRNHLRITWDGGVFTTVLEASGSKYPPVERFFDATLQATAVISRGELLSGLKVTGLVAKDTYVNLELLKDSGGLLIGAQQKHGSKSQVTVVVQNSNNIADSIVIFKHLRSAIDILDTAFITLEFRALPNDLLAPSLLDGAGFQHMILPAEPNDGSDEEDANGEG